MLFYNSLYEHYPGPVATTDPGQWQLQIQGIGNHGFKVLCTEILVLRASNSWVLRIRIHGCFGFEFMGASDWNPNPKHQRFTVNSRALLPSSIPLPSTYLLSLQEISIQLSENHFIIIINIVMMKLMRFILSWSLKQQQQQQHKKHPPPATCRIRFTHPQQR